MKVMKQSQRGSVWAILLVLVAMVVGGWQYSEHKAEKKRQELEAVAQKERDAKREAERVALEQRQAAEKAQSDALAASNKALNAVLSRWDDAVKLAGNTSRIALATPVATMQGIRREAENLSVSPCMDPAKDHLHKSMQSTIDGFIVFMRNELKIGDKLSQIDFAAAAEQFSAFKLARESCANQGAA